MTTLLKREFIGTYLLLVFIVLYAEADRDEEHEVEGLFALDI